MRRFSIALLRGVVACLLFLARTAFAQDTESNNGSHGIAKDGSAQNGGAHKAGVQEETPIDKQRVLGILPNYRTINASVPYSPITTKEKFAISARDTFDYPVFFIAAGFAGLYQMENQNPSWGQGVEGYAKRFGAAYADQAIGNFLTEGAVPSALHQDPRYFRMGPEGGGTARRVEYSLTRVFVARNDKGHWTFNYPEWVGNASAVAISNAYYPADTRNAKDNAEKLCIQVATDAFTNFLKEFWPDWKRKIDGRKHAKL